MTCFSNRFSTTEPAATRALWPISMFAEILAPAPIITPRRILGWRSSFSLSGAARVTPCRIETSSSITAVLADREAGGVVEEEPLRSAPPVDVDLEFGRRPALDIEGEVAAALLVEPVRQAMRLDGVEALEVQQRVDEARGRGIAVVHRHQIGAEGVADVAVVAQRLAVGLADQVAGQRRMVEALGDAVHNGGLQPVVVQHAGIDEGRQLRLARDDLLRLLPDPGPTRIDGGEGWLGVEVGIDHGAGSGGSDRQDTTR